MRLDIEFIGDEPYVSLEQAIALVKQSQEKRADRTPIGKASPTHHAVQETQLTYPPRVQDPNLR